MQIDDRGGKLRRGVEHCQSRPGWTTRRDGGSPRPPTLSLGLGFRDGFLAAEKRPQMRRAGPITFDIPNGIVYNPHKDGRCNGR
jgi:hypothetical protein